MIHRQRQSDATLEGQAPAVSGGAGAHPRTVTVDSRDGSTILNGPILPTEEHQARNAARAIAGVNNVDVQFDGRTQPAGAVSLTGGLSHPALPDRLDVRQHAWAPATRAVVGSSGAALVAAGALRGDRIGLGLAGAGAALVTRALTNLEFGPLVGLGAGRRAVDVQKTITVDLPVDRVFAFWDDIANLPTIMHHVREVRATGDPSHWHWTICDAAITVPIEFDTVVTERVPNRTLAWHTIAGSVVGHAGLIRFDAIDTERTRLQIRLLYNPPGGSLGHDMLALIGADPTSQLGEDLGRMKTALENAGADDVPRA